MTTYADAKAALQAVLVTAQPQGAITPERLATALVALTDALNDLATADKYVVGLQSYNSTTNVLTLLLSDASTVDINMTTLIADAVADRIPTSEKAAANGVASLDGSGKLATAQRPTTDGITEGTTNLYHTASRVNALISAAAGSVVQAFSATLSSLAALTTTTFGRSLLTETSASTLKTTLALTKSDVGLSSVDNTADASKSFTASQISNSTTVGRNVLTAVDQAAARSAIGVGAGTGDLVSTNNLSDVSNAATAKTNLGVGTADSPQFAGVNIGHATDTTVTRASAGVLAVEGNHVPSPASAVQGDVLYHNGTTWARLAAGTSGQFLKTNGAAANPAWADGGTTVGTPVTSGTIGYGTGTGGTVTQTTSQTTAVTLNKMSGKITTVSLSITDTSNEFTFNNSLIGADDILVLQGQLSTAGRLSVRGNSAGSRIIRIDVSSTLSGVQVIPFVVLKVATA